MDLTDEVNGTERGVQLIVSVEVARRFVPWPPIIERGGGVYGLWALVVSA
jgi:hypothetical protein